MVSSMAGASSAFWRTQPLSTEGCTEDATLIPLLLDMAVTESNSERDDEGRWCYGDDVITMVRAQLAMVRSCSDCDGEGASVTWI